MAANMQDTLRELLISTLEGAGKGSDSNGDQQSANPVKGGSGGRAVAAGVGAAALAPLAMKGLSRLAQAKGLGDLQGLVKSPGQALQGLGDSVGSNLGDKLSDKVDEAGGPSGIIGDTVKQALPFGGGGDDGGGKPNNEGVGKGRRMPVQQSVDIGVPLENVYNQFTQFEDWPQFMHRVKNVSQEDDCTLQVSVKIWGKTKEFTAKIETQRPDERLKWKSSQGMTHAGVITFHELAPNLTRVILNFDVDPDSLIVKAARGMRHIKRATRADLHRFAAFIEMMENETGAWRGVIEDGELVEEHDPSYDEGREYSDPEDLQWDSDEEDSDEQDSDEQEDDSDEQPEASDEEEEKPRSRRRRQSSSNGHGADEDEKPKTRSSRGRSSGSGSSRGSSSSNRSTRAASGSRSSSRSSSGSSGRSSNGSSGGSGRGSSGSGGSRSTRRSSGSSSSGRRSRSRGASN